MTSNVNTDTILKSILFLIFFSVFIYNLDRIFIEHKEIILLMLLMSCMQYAWPEVFYITMKYLIRETLVFFYILQYLCYKIEKTVGPSYSFQITLEI